jgi:predicted PurR-regulated permease PerM
MNWFIILVAVIAIGELLGIFGMIIGIPALLFIKRIWSDFVMGRSDGILEYSRIEVKA